MHTLVGCGDISAGVKDRTNRELEAVGRRNPEKSTSRVQLIGGIREQTGKHKYEKQSDLRSQQLD